MKHSRFAHTSIMPLLLGLVLLSGQCPPLAAAAPAEPLTVQILPAGKVKRLTQLVASFSRSMRPLGDMAQEAASSPLKLTPLPAGSYRWLDSQNLAFILDQPQSGATRLKASVSPCARSLDGAVLAQGAEAALYTPEIEVTEFDNPLAPKPELRVILNQPVEVESLSARAFLEVAGKRLPPKAQELPSEQWRVQDSQLERVYALEAPQDLPPRQAMQVVLEPGLKLAQGPWPPS